MGGKTKEEELSGIGLDRPTEDVPGAEVVTHPGGVRFCCGRTMECQLAEVDRFGQLAFAAVCRCPACGRLVVLVGPAHFRPKRAAKGTEETS